MKYLINSLVLILLIAPETYAVRRKSKGRADNTKTFKVVAIERNTDFPVYKAKVSFVSFSGTKKAETDASGSAEMEFPNGETVALSISAEGYHDTTTKGYKLSKDRTVKVKMRQNGRVDPLPTPIPPRQPTNPPFNPPTFPTFDPGQPTPQPGFPTPQPGFPTPRPPVGPTHVPPSDVNPPVIIIHPESQMISRGQPGTFRVSASGTGPLSYQWHLNGVAVGTNSSTYIFKAPIAVGSSIQQFTIICTVSNAGGSTVSRAAYVRVMPLFNTGDFNSN